MIAAGQKDQNALRNSLQLFFHPFDPNSHDSNVLTNICSGETVWGKTNVYLAKAIDEKQMK